MTIDALNTFCKNTMVDTLGIEFTAFDGISLSASMPVNQNTIQPMKYLHGGALLSLAESLASAGSVLVLDDPTKKVFGITISAQHIKSVREGMVHGKALLLRKTTHYHYWEVKIFNRENELLSNAQLTITIVA